MVRSRIASYRSLVACQLYETAIYILYAGSSINKTFVRDWQSLGFVIEMLYIREIYEYHFQAMSRRAGGIIPRPSATLTATKGSSSPCPPRPAPSTRATTTTGIVITRTEYSTRSEETLPQVRSSTTTKPLSSKSTLNNVASSHSTRPSKDAAAVSITLSTYRFA